MILAAANKASFCPVGILNQNFYARDSRLVAFELIGKVLVFKRDGDVLCGRVAETEAYLGSQDPASHAHRGMTPRNCVMFGPAGFSYVYFTYGFHHCLNVVTESEGVAGAVLIRAVEPVRGIELMMKRRGCRDVRSLTSGPGKLTQAFGITVAQSGLDLTADDFHFEEENHEDLKRLGSDCPRWLRIGVSPRVGIREGTKSLFRFFLQDSPFVSVFPKHFREK